MADVAVRGLDDEVADVLRARAAQRGISLEEEVRRTLIASVDAQRAEYVRALRKLQAAARALRQGQAAGAAQDER